VAERCDTVGMKTDCGQVGTTQEECESKGCCWEKSDEENTPWCFHRIQLNE
jgi:glucoamylase